MTRSRAARHRGFTLLELLVVLVIFAILAAMAYGGLSSVMNTRAKVETSLARTQQFEQAYIRLRQDFQTASLRRGARDNDGVMRYPFQYDTLTDILEFTHGGLPDPLGLPRTGFERVAYRLRDHKLVRSVWRVLDRAPRTEPVDTTLLDNIDDLSWRFLDNKAQWETVWPSNQSGAATQTVTTTVNGVANTNSVTIAPPPVAVELRMHAHDWGDIRLLFELGFDPAATVNAANAASGGS